MQVTFTLLERRASRQGGCVLAVGQLTIVSDGKDADSKLLLIAEIDDWQCGMISDVTGSEHSRRFGIVGRERFELSGSCIEGELKQSVVILHAGDVSESVVWSGSNTVGLGIGSFQSGGGVADYPILFNTIDGYPSTLVVRALPNEPSRL